MKHRWWFVLVAYGLYYLGMIDHVLLGAAIVAVLVLHVAITKGIIATPPPSLPPRIYPEGQEPDAAEWKSFSGRTL